MKVPGFPVALTTQNRSMMRRLAGEVPGYAPHSTTAMRCLC